MASDLSFGGGPLRRQMPILSCSANEEEEEEEESDNCLETTSGEVFYKTFALFKALVPILDWIVHNQQHINWRPEFKSKSSKNFSL